MGPEVRVQVGRYKACMEKRYINDCGSIRLALSRICVSMDAYLCRYKYVYILNVDTGFFFCSAVRMIFEEIVELLWPKEKAGTALKTQRNGFLAAAICLKRVHNCSMGQ